MNDKANLSLPAEIVDGLNEFSPAGFILFIMNEKGSPEAFHTYDSDMGALALQNFAALWIQAIHESQSDTMLKLINSPPSDEEVSEEE